MNVEQFALDNIFKITVAFHMADKQKISELLFFAKRGYHRNDKYCFFY